MQNFSENSHFLRTKNIAEKSMAYRKKTAKAAEALYFKSHKPKRKKLKKPKAPPAREERTFDEKRR